MSRQGEGRFRTTLARVIDDHELWITAGDFVNRRPLRIEIVDPPRLDQLELLCDYPSYTGLDAIEDKPVSVQSLQTSLPMETALCYMARQTNRSWERFSVASCLNCDSANPDREMRRERCSEPAPARWDDRGSLRDHRDWEIVAVGQRA